jgi:hypothetical protein
MLPGIYLGRKLKAYPDMFFKYESLTPILAMI